mmetsp:Transcript_34496/g.47160  ORF Transcript_34496/g.47160 Transcript_34496/m.47160 type:complete len:103 (-) Transcript_34496:83-391(-)
MNVGGLCSGGDGGCVEWKEEEERKSHTENVVVGGEKIDLKVVGKRHKDVVVCVDWIGMEENRFHLEGTDREEGDPQRDRKRRTDPFCLRKRWATTCCHPPRL